MGEAPTADDYASIDRAADELRRRGWAKRYSLNEAIDDWCSLVDAVEIGYAMTIDDYTNAVSIRQWLEDARSFLTPGITRSMDARMAPIDVRFLNATEPISRFLPGAGGGWWSHRLPKVLSDELANDVARLDLREPYALSDDEPVTDPLCVRCGKAVVRNLAHYETYEKMHWVCFHYEFEHSSADVDASCGDPHCPARLSDPDAPPPWPSK